MTTLLLAVVLAAGADDKGAAAPPVEGKWLIVYAEAGGRRNNAWEQRQATIRDNTLTYPGEGKDHSIRLKFGPNQTVEASEGAEGRAHKGVYVVGRDYLCLSLESGTFGGADGAAKADKGQSSGSFILILRRQRAAKPEQ